MFTLGKADYSKVKMLFEEARYQLFPAAVLNGNLEGKVFVDDLDEPRSGSMITREVWAYLVGDPSNRSFNQAMNQTIFTKGITEKEPWGYFISCSPEWQPVLEEIIHPTEAVEVRRRHYRGRKLDFEWQDRLPDGYTLEFISDSLRTDGRDLPQDVGGLLQSWESIPDPRQRGFGFVAMQGDEIAAHAVIDVVVETRGDMGLETQPHHRRKGLATVVSAATAAYGFQQGGLTEILWDCSEDNLGSRKIAERLGFEYQNSHNMYLFDFDLIDVEPVQPGDEQAG